MVEKEEDEAFAPQNKEEEVEQVTSGDADEVMEESGTPLMESETKKSSNTGDELETGSPMMMSSKREPAPKGGCRQCFSLPHGINSVVAYVIATIAWVFTIVSLNNCHFLTSHYLYCHPAPEAAQKFGTCGDCHCINLNETCPTEVPLTDMSDDWLKQLKRYVEVCY